MIFSQLVCRGCGKVLSYPHTAISCACRNCGTVNASSYLRVRCGCCRQSLLLPTTTLTFLCPVCATVTDIPEDFLPAIEDPVDLGNGVNGDRAGNSESRTIYVSYPALNAASPGQKEEQKKECENRQAARQRAREKEQALRAHLLEIDSARNAALLRERQEKESGRRVGSAGQQRATNTLEGSAETNDDSGDGPLTREELEARDVENSNSSAARDNSDGGNAIPTSSLLHRHQEGNPAREEEEERPPLTAEEQREVARQKRQRKRAAKTKIVIATRIL